MTDQANPNMNEVFGLSSDALDVLFTRANEQAVADREARQRAAAWPNNVEQALLAVATRIKELNARISSLEDGRG